MITAAVLFDSHLTARTLLRVGGDPVGGLAVVVALLLPPLQQITFDWFVPVFAAEEAGGGGNDSMKCKEEVLCGDDFVFSA